MSKVLNWLIRTWSFFFSRKAKKRSPLLGFYVLDQNRRSPGGLHRPHQERENGRYSRIRQREPLP